MPTDPQLFELRALQAMLHGLIRVRMMQFNADSNLELPDLVTMFAGKQADLWFPIPGMIGGFQIRLIQSAKNELIVFAESGSRAWDGWMRHKERGSRLSYLFVRPLLSALGLSGGLTSQ
jgi:hypothetical protein